MALATTLVASSAPRRRLRGLGLFAAILALWCTATLGAWWFDGLLAWSAGLLYIAYDTWLIAYVAWNTRRLGLAAPAATATMPLPRIGVIVPARNEAAVLPQTIDALLAQTAPPEAIIVIDDGSTDATRHSLIQRYAMTDEEGGLAVSTRHPGLRLLSKPHSGKADSMNTAWPLLDSDVVLTIDADTQLASDAVAAMREAFAREPELAAACGVLRPGCSEGRLRGLFQWFQRFEYLRTFLARAAWMRADALLLVSGAFAGYRRSVLEHIGGFDRDSLVEDYELIHRLHRHAHDHGLHWRVRVLGEAQARTDAPGGLLQFLRQRRRWFAGFLQTQFAYRHMHGDARYGAIGTLMLPVKAVDTLQPLFGLTAFALLLGFVVSDAPIAPAVLAVIGLKLVIDLAYHLWAIRLYYRWLGQPRPRGIAWSALLATLAEPFSFQLVRHSGAIWGWLLFLRRRNDWVPQRRGV